MSKTKLKEVVIDRAKWLTGEAIESDVVEMSNLRDKSTGMMCCLGFLATQHGFTEKEITDKGELYDLSYSVKNGIKRVEALIPDTCSLGSSTDNTLSMLMMKNDNTKLDRKEREHIIKENLQKLGFRAKFVGRYPNYKKLARNRDVEVS